MDLDVCHVFILNHVNLCLIVGIVIVFFMRIVVMLFVVWVVFSVIVRGISRVEFFQAGQASPISLIGSYDGILVDKYLFIDFFLLHRFHFSLFGLLLLFG